MQIVTDVENEAALKPLLLETGGTTKVAERGTDRSRFKTIQKKAVVTGHGISTTTKYFAVLGMPLVKTVTRAGPKGKSLTGRERKRVSDLPPTRSTRTKTTSLLPRLRNCTIG